MPPPQSIWVLFWMSHPVFIELMWRSAGIPRFIGSLPVLQRAISCHVFGAIATFFSISSLIDLIFPGFLLLIYITYLSGQCSYCHVFLIYYVTLIPMGRLRRSLFFFLLYHRCFQRHQGVVNVMHFLSCFLNARSSYWPSLLLRSSSEYSPITWRGMSLLLKAHGQIG